MGLIATNTNDFNFMLSSIVEKASTLVIEPIDYAQTGDSPAMHGFAFRYSSIQKLLRDYKVLLYSNLIEIVDSIETVLTLDASIEEVFTGYENRDTSVVVDLSDTVTTYSEYSTLIYYAPQTASFDVRYVDMQHFFAVSNPEIERLIVDVEGLITSISNFANSDVIVGEGAASIKNFLVEVHVEILMLIKNILLLYAEIMGRYSKEYIDRGENDLYVIVKSELEEYKLALNTKKNEYETHASSIKSIICTNVEFSSRDDLPKYDISYNTRIEIDNLISYIDSVIDFVEQIEEGYRTELENGQLSEVSAELITAIQNVQVSSGYEVLSYDISNIVGVDSIEALRQYNSAFNERTDEILNQSYRDLATLVAEGGGVYEEAAMEEAIADARMDALSSALILVVAGAAAIMAPIVFCASPLVIAAGIGIGGASVVSGLSTTGEIVYEVYNPGEEGFNLVRDIYFGGDQRAFDIYNEVLLSADASIIGASLFGGNTAVKDIAFDVISEVSGIAVGEIARINGASETEQAALVFATSIATNMGLNSIDEIASSGMRRYDDIARSADGLANNSSTRGIDASIEGATDNIDETVERIGETAEDIGRRVDDVNSTQINDVDIDNQVRMADNNVGADEATGRVIRDTDGPNPSNNTASGSEARAIGDTPNGRDASIEGATDNIDETVERIGETAEDIGRRVDDVNSTQINDVDIDNQIRMADNTAGEGGTGSYSLLPGEGEIGTYRDLLDAGEVGDNITPHHMPSAEYMAQYGVGKKDGLCMNMEMPCPGTGGRHRLTDTYGRNMTDAERAYYYSLSPRDALAYDIANMRQIYQSQGLYSEIRPNLQEYIRQYKELMPELFDK